MKCKNHHKGYTIVCYNSPTLKKDCPTNIEDYLIIIDEVQNLVSMCKNSTINGIFLFKKLFYALNVKIIMLSGTPSINDPYEYNVLFNILNPRSFELDRNVFYNKYVEGNQIKNKREFQKKIFGLVSYIKGASENSSIFPKSRINIIKLKIQNGSLQKKIYLELKAIEDAKETYPKKKNYLSYVMKVIKKDPEEFLIGLRQACNYVNNDLHFDVNKVSNNLKNYSIKFDYIFNKMNETNGLIVIYSFFVEKTIDILAEIMKYRKIKYEKFIGGYTDNQKARIINTFNLPQNVNGGLIKVLLLSSAGGEGLSLKKVRQMHILEPHWNELKIKQVIGRGIRICSHYILPPEERNVDVFRYIATIDRVDTADEIVYNISKRKLELTTSFENAIKEVAVDCNINKIINDDVDQCLI
jgi:SNF2 family DNA or RNA helicase